jgi:hypothetical protein
MRIIDEENNKTLNSILIMLTPEEAAELASKLKSLDPTNGEHLHVDDIDYKREITVAIYTAENSGFFADEIRRILAEE